MRFLFVALITLASQGCTIVGAALDSTLDLDRVKNKDNKTLVDHGMRIDYEILNILVNGQSIDDSKATTSCSDLKGKQKADCLKKVNALNESIKKHTK
ncbi:hypothetical protein ISG33_05295 [Glaciecola sp. MH2013]|uniref:hypothetical protein n=1 Tax=Glaciecola sp. MH2013 TaxID=2785524 RepID=UPI00189E02E6|nr:hypothetical protein [Glaciecola sp. MH2013]MBF7072816.1 hypothetical protein [Glaciecola sp. MH2013]